MNWTVRPPHARRNAVVVLAVALAALVLGGVAFGQPLLGALGFALVVGSTLDHLLPSHFALDAKGATARTGPSVTAIEWGAVERVLVDGLEIRLSPLARPSRMLDATRGVGLVTLPENRESVLAFVEGHVHDAKREPPQAKRVDNSLAMHDFWQEELTNEERDRFLDKAAGEIRRRRLEAPAILALEMHRPLAGLASHAMVAFAPFAIPFFGYDGVHDVSRLLKDRQNVERLVQRLECPVGN